MLPCTDNISRNHIYLGYSVYLIAEKLDSYGTFTVCYRENLNNVSPYPECTSVKLHLISAVLEFYKTLQDIVSFPFHTGSQRKRHTSILFGVTQAVYTGHTGNNKNIFSLKKSRCGRMSKLIYFVIYCRILFDIGIRTGYVSLGLIVIIVTNEVLHSILREYLLKLAVKLGSKGFIMGYNKGWFLKSNDYVCHGKGLSGARNTKKCLKFLSFLKAFNKFFYCLRLVTGGLEF